jgi:hypothetical protein
VVRDIFDQVAQAAFNPGGVGMNLAMAGVDHRLFGIRFVDRRFEPPFPDSLVPPTDEMPAIAVW